MVDQEDEQRYRLVVLGAGKVGKTSIVHRFLSGKFSDTYRPTVEDLHSRCYTIGSTAVRLDILDTAGNLEFPAMRRLSISTAHGFLLVFGADDPRSFDEVRRLWDEIRDQRSADYRRLPCVVAANKCDAVPSPLAALERPADWARGEDGRALVSVSAKTGENVVDIFRKLLQQARAITSGDDDDEGDGGGGAGAKDDSALRRHGSANAARMHPQMARLREKKERPQLGRSRSLIRRSRKPKVKAEVTADDCVVS